jgi:hypothetical protein
MASRRDWQYSLWIALTWQGWRRSELGIRVSTAGERRR